MVGITDRAMNLSDMIHHAKWKIGPQHETISTVTTRHTARATADCASWHGQKAMPAAAGL